MGIFGDYPIRTRRSKRYTWDFPGFKIIPSDPLIYTRSKQGLKGIERACGAVCVHCVRRERRRIRKRECGGVGDEGCGVGWWVDLY